MSLIDHAARSAAHAAVLAAFVVSGAAHAAAAAPPPPPAPKHIPYQGAAQTKVTEAYEYRTRILTGKPGCQRYADESDAAFLDDRLGDVAKAARLKGIGDAAAAAGCLGP